jgi:hypothetical protein
MLKKIEIHEEWIEEYRTEIDKYRTEIENVYKRLKMVDDKNLFEKVNGRWTPKFNIV